MLSKKAKTKIYELPLSRGYVSKWGVVEAVRELLQNAIDSAAPFEFEWIEDPIITDTWNLYIVSRGVRLDPATLVLGRTVKGDDETSIGQFGEGYKLALLVLTREGIRVDVGNVNVQWTPYFDISKQFDTETLHIKEEVIDADIREDELCFMIIGLTPSQKESISMSCLLMQPVQENSIGTSYGRILPSRPGQLYVNGLYVCTTNMQFGYDIKPLHLKLERDRQTVNGWDLQWITKEMWFETTQYDKIAEMMEKGFADVATAQWSSTPMVREACYQRFIKQHPDSLAVKSQEELEAAIARGMTKTIVVQSAAYHANIINSISFQQSPQSIPPPTPEQVLCRWLDDNRAYMTETTIGNFGKLMAEAKSWRLK